MPFLPDYSGPDFNFSGGSDASPTNWWRVSQGVGDLFQAGASIFQGFATKAADIAQSQVYGEEAQFLGLAQQQQESSDFLKYMAEQRRAGQVIGREESATAASGRSYTGSAMALIRESTLQGAYEQSIAAQQADINFQNYQGQITAANMEAEALSKAGQSAALGGILGGVGALAKGAFLFL